MEKWFGKVAVVTGASAGIGAQIVRDLAKNGFTVVGLARRPEKVEEIANEVGKTSGKIFAYKCDVSDRQSIKDAFKWIEDKFSFVHVLINNAGCGFNIGVLSDDSDDDDKLEQVINTNLTGLVHATRSAFRLMKKSDDYGMIVNINSVVGHITPFPAEGESKSNVYGGTKHAVTATTEVIRQQLICMNNKKIRISSVSPGVVETDFFHAGKFVPDDFSMGSMVAALDSADISDAVLYLLTTPYHVNITEMTVRPVGERF